MVFLKVVCWAYLLWTILGRIVNYDNKNETGIKIRIIDNITIISLVILIYFLNK